MSHPYDALMSEVTDVKDLGSGVIRGECDHLAFRTRKGWIGKSGLPRDRTPTLAATALPARKVAGFPQYTIDIRSWKAGADVAAGDFSFKAPDGAQSGI